MTSEESWKKVEELIDRVEKTSDRLLSKAEKILVERLMDALYTYEQNKTLESKKDLTSVIDEVFDEFESRELRVVVDTLAKEIVQAMTAVNEYFKLQIKSANFIAISKKITSDILGKMGIDLSEKSFKVVVGGYLDSLTKNAELRNSVQKIIVDAVINKAPFSELMKSLIKNIEATGESEGKLQKYFKTMAVDTFSQASRIQEDQIADRFKMDAFLFSGTVIGTTRCFCKERSGKVILVREALSEWPELRNEPCGPRWSDDLEYEPLKHMGGHRCRHHKRYITNTEAQRRDSTIKVDAKGKAYRAV